jgi:hypothetical protein
LVGILPNIPPVGPLPPLLFGPSPDNGPDGPEDGMFGNDGALPFVGAVGPSLSPLDGNGNEGIFGDGPDAAPDAPDGEGNEIGPLLGTPILLSPNVDALPKV